NAVVTAIALIPLCVTAALAQTRSYNIGRIATPEEIRAWDISIGPDGKELPPGSGTAKEGATLYAQKCAACHGPNGDGGLTRGIVPLGNAKPVKNAFRL